MSAKRIVGVALLLLIGVGALPITRDEVHWRWAALRDQAPDYVQYLAWWPQGRHVGEARKSHDERSWADANAARTVDAYRQYQQTHPQGAHSAEAGVRAEDLTWESATSAQTIASFRAYAQDFPQGRFIGEARKREAALRVDDASYTAALKAGTEVAFRAFLQAFPGHSKEAKAKETLRDIVEGRDIVDLLQEKKIEITTQGNGIQNVSVRVRRLTSHPLTVRIPPGTYFVSARKSAQNMVATTESKIQLATDAWQSITVPAACANRPLAVPGGNDTFSVQRSPHQKELARLMPVVNRAGVSYATRQAAVWIVTDNASYADLGVLVSRQAGSSFSGSRTIQEGETARAMRICEEAGIDITKKSIWRDRRTILQGLRDENLRTWLEAKK